jgi:hypothetical protein
MVGSFRLAVATLLVIGHHRREWMRRRRSGEWIIDTVGRDAKPSLMTLAGSCGRSFDECAFSKTH